MFHVMIKSYKFQVCLNLNEIPILNFSNGHNQKVHMHMVDLMSSIICEGDTVSQELLDTVLVNLVPAHKVSSKIYLNIYLKPINSSVQNLLMFKMQFILPYS